MKILLVDDDEYLRDMYTIKFTQNDHIVQVADCGSKAISILRQVNDFDIILLDMIMPGMTGVELLQKIQEEFPNLKSKRIVLSNQGQPEDMDEAKEAGAVGYIIKADSIPSEVLKKVEAIYNK